MKTALSLGLLILLLSACKDTQINLALKAGIKNTFSSSIDTKASSEAYSHLKSNTDGHSTQATLLKSLSSGETVACEYPFHLDILNQDAIDSFSKVKNAMCSCAPWGTCSSKACDCSELCPENFNIFNRPSYSDGTNFIQHLAVSNMNSARNDLYTEDRKAQGYCWGIALVEQKFNRLASFKPAEARSFPKQEQERDRRKYYSSIIENIIANRPVDIPGFMGLKEFSEDPEVRELLLPVIKKEWSNNAITGQGIKIVTSSSPRPKEEYLSTFDSLEYRTKNFQSTIITFNKVGNAKHAHSVLINKTMKLPDGSRVACTIDSNYEFYVNEGCTNFFLLDSKGKMSYVQKGASVMEVGQFQIGKSEDSNAVEQVKNLVEKCRNEKGCST